MHRMSQSSLPARFGERVKERRLSQNLSQEELAHRCGIHRTYIGAIERGEKVASLETIVKIVSGLGLTISEFFVDFETQP